MRSGVKRVVLLCCAAGVLAAGCAPRATFSPPTDRQLSRLDNRLDARNSYTGYCDFVLEDGRVRASLAIQVAGDTVRALCTDELGMQLGHVVATSGGITVERAFPPLKKTMVATLGYVARAYHMVAQKRFTDDGAYTAPLCGRLWLAVFAQGREADSFLIGKEETPLYAAKFERQRIFFMNASGDTILFCHIR